MPSRLTPVAVALSAVALTSGALSATPASGATHRGLAATAPTSVETVAVRMTKSKISMAPGTLHAGRVAFNVTSGDGKPHVLQLLRLRGHYTLVDLTHDLPKAFHGDVKAVRRVDRHIVALGGAEATADRPGQVAVNLRRNHYVALDQNGQGHRAFTVTGSATSSPQVPYQGRITAYTYGFGTAGRLPADGDIHFRDVSDQPHFVEFQHVADTTTHRQVRRYFNGRSQRRPTWIESGHSTVGLMSPDKSQVVHVELPAGKYLIACFWPDDDTGMPHALMGMWKLVWLH